VRITPIGAILGLLLASPAPAGPWLDPGDSALRHDIQVLADAGVIRGPVTTWPLSWGDIASSLSVSQRDVAPDVAASLTRVERQLTKAVVTNRLQFEASASVAANPRQIRTFEDGPREDAEVGVGANWTGDRFAFNLEGQWVDDPEDGDDWRADGSYVGVALGNWMLAASVTDRWWGPAWQGSLILGNDNRPIPAFTLERNSTEAFESPWLRWIGPWDLAAFYGFLEDDRFVPDARLMGLRVSARPFRSLELGLSRTAIWCGEGKSCDFDTFVDVLLGSSGSDDAFSEGDQRAGWDARWSGRLFSQPVAVYGNMIGEDSADVLPSSWFGQFGAETYGLVPGLGSYRFYLEWADTECDFRFYQSIRGDDDPADPECAYNNSIYQTGYRYKGRSIGHSFDGNASVFTLGSVLVDEGDNSWMATFGIGNLNRRSQTPDPRNTVAEVKTRYREFELTHKRDFSFGRVSSGVGYDYRKDTTTGDSDGDFRVFVDWSRGW
jgi:hypothetical protein